MKKITVTQNSTGRQMDYMAKNLQERHKTPVSFQRLSTAFKSGKIETKYWINVQGVDLAFKDTWAEAQDFYKQLIRLDKGGIDNA